MSASLTNQVIIITGASSGIGAATAIACAAAGMNVVLNARRVDRLEAVAATITELGQHALIVGGDVAEPGISERMLDAAFERFGRLDAVFANAGYTLNQTMLETSMEELRALFEVDFFASVDLLHKAAQRLIALKRPGNLLMCSSCLAKLPMPYHGAYSAAKAAQNHVCRAMRIELKPHRINVASVHPIGTKTELFQVAAIRNGATAEAAAAADTEVPRPFMQSAEHVAKAVVRSLERPKPEVWTSFTVRFAAGVLTIWPGFADLVMNSVAKRHKKRNRPGAHSR